MLTIICKLSNAMHIIAARHQCIVPMNNTTFNVAIQLPENWQLHKTVNKPTVVLLQQLIVHDNV